MFFNKKVDEITVTATGNDNLIWKVTTDGVKFDKTVKLNVGTGCQAVIYLNGALVGAPKESGSHDINMKKALKNGDKIDIIGVRRDAEFVIKFGLSSSNSVPYEDAEAKLTTKVSVSGECYCKVIDGSKIYSAYGCPDAITALNVREKVFGGITQILVDSLGKKLKEFSYLEIAGSVNDLSATVKSLVEQRLAEQGILLQSCSVAMPYFGEDYAERRERAIKEREHAEREQDEHDRAMRIVEKSIAASASSQDRSKTIKCNKCGKQNAVGTKFCQYCGSKLI